MGETSSFSYNQSSILCGFVAQWITRLTTDQEIPGSTPGKLDRQQLDRQQSCEMTAELNSISARILLVIRPDL